MSDFETRVELYRDNALSTMRKWGKMEAAKEIHREFLSECGLRVKSNTKLDELLTERHRLALESQDETIRLKAIDSSLAMAAGSEKITLNNNTQNNFSFEGLLREIKAQENGK